MSGHLEPGRSEPRDTLLLYCPYDRRVTRHARRGGDQDVVCLECGRPIDNPERDAGEAHPEMYEQRTARVSPVVEPPPGRRSQARPRPRRSRGGWVPVVVAIIALLVGVLGAVNVAGNLAAPADTVAPAPGQSSSVPGNQGATSAPAEEAQYVRIANTGGEGAYVRRTTNLDDRLRPWPENTRLRVLGPDASANGAQWKHIEDPAGNQGWIPAEYTRAE